MEGDRSRLAHHLRRTLSKDRRQALWAFWASRHRLQGLLAWPVRRHLNLLAIIYGTDKSSFFHGYAKLYARYLSPSRRSVRSVLEIGIGGVTSAAGYDTLAGGHSLRMWQTYFPKAQIVGVDIERKLVPGRRISVERGSQDDNTFLRDVADRYGPFDLVIDDGSHIGRHVEASFEVLFERVKPGGFYVIEDLGPSYLPAWEGGPPGHPGTQSELLKRLVDDVLRRHWDTAGTAPPLRALHLHDQIAFLERA